MSEPPKFSFGQPASSSGSAPSLFGSAAPKPDSNSGGGLFGGANKTPTSAGFSFGGAASTGASPNLFGAAASTGTPTSAGFSFGQKAPEKQNSNPTTPGVAPTGNPFGAAPSTGSGLFGNNSAATPATNANKPSLFSTTPAGPPPGGLFGAKPTAPSTSLFGQKPEAPSSEAPKSAPTFGAPLGGNAGSGGLFGAQKPSDTPASNPPQNASMFGSFGQQKKDDQPTSSSGATPSLFGQKPAENAAPANKPTFNLGGGASTTPQSAPGAFSLGGATSQPSSSQPASATTSAPSGGLFGGLGGASTSAAPASSGSSAPSLFGAKKDSAPEKPAAPAAGGLFGNIGQNKDAADKPAAPSGGLFGSAGQNKDDAAKPPAPSGGLFGGIGKKDDSAKPAAPAGGLFGGLGGKKDDSASSSAAAPPSTTATSGATPSFTLGKPAESGAPASTGGSTGGAGGFSLKPAPTPAGGSASTPAAPSSTGGAALNASTSGPTPPATSRLNSKSLDEIITLWTTSLSSHQKQFSNLATKIGSWDRMLVENSDKISKLYSRTFQAERDTAEVERQLASVEGQQEELSHWLDHYERVLDDMAAKAGGVDSGVDAERERTYRTAERCSTRLTTMSHDLTSMIEEINLASTNLSKSSKTAESDPLSQIVRVLNAHLGQLQQIDVGAEQLRQKVESAQKEVRGFGGRVGDEGGVEGFMRSLRR